MKKLLVWILLCTLLAADIPARAAVDDGTADTAEQNEGMSGKVYYISTADELMEILQAYNYTGISSYGMPEYSYFELVEDIDLSGYTWKPVNLNGMFNGNGHTIRNITIEGYGGMNASTEKYAGFFAMGLNSWQKDYVTNLNLENVQMEIEIGAQSQITRLNVSPVIGDTGVAINNCSVSGSVSVTSESDTTDISLTGFGNAGGCQGEMDLEVTGKAKALETLAISESANCRWEGDITVNVQGESGRVEAGGVHAGKGCTYTGDIEVQAENDNEGNVSAYGGFGEDCHMEGDVTLMSGEGNAQIYGLGGTGSSMEGDMYAGGAGEVSAVGMSDSVAGYNPSVVGHVKDSLFTGNVTVKAQKHISVTGIENGESSQFNGNIHAVSSEDSVDATGMTDASGSFFYGEVSAMGNSSEQVRAYGDTAGSGESEDNYFRGNIHAENTYIQEDTMGAEAVAVGSSGTNSYVEGNLTATAERPSAMGLTGEDSYFYGNISVNASEDGFGALISSDYSGNNIAEGKVNIHSSSEADGALIDGYSASNNYAKGDLYVNGAERSSAEAIREDVGEGNRASGTVTAEVTEADIRNSSRVNANGSPEGSTFEGTVTGICNGLSGTVSQTGGVQYFMRGGGNTLYLSTNRNDGGSFVGSVTFGSGGEVMTPEEEWSPADAENEESKSVYSLRIMDVQTEQPVKDADVIIDETSYQTDGNGMVTVTGALFIQNLEVRQGGDIIHTQSRFSVTAGKTNMIYVNGLNLDLSNINMEKLGEATVNGPETGIDGFSLFELPISFDMNILDQMQVAYDADQKMYQVIVMGSGDYTREQDGVVDAREPMWKKVYEEFKYQFKQGCQDFRDKSFKGVNRDFGTKNSSVRAGGYLEFAVTDEGLKLTDGELIVRANASYSASYPIPPAPYIYLKFGVESGIQTNADFEFADNNVKIPKINMSADMAFQLMPSLGVGAGLHKIMSAEVGIDGPLDVSLELPFTSMEEDVRVTLTAKAYLQLTALAFNIKFSEAFAQKQLYPAEKEQENQSKALTFDDVPDSEEMNLIDRSYLETPAARSADEGKQDTIKNSVYPYGTVQSARLSDGRTLVVWLDDDIQRNLIDKTALYYSIINDGVWSTPAQIENDGTADFSFDLCETDSGATLVWQDAGESLTENTGADALAQSVDLSFAEFDAASDSFGEIINLTGNNGESPAGTNGGADNEIYEYSPKLYANGSDIHVIWNQNENNNVILSEEMTGETIYYMNVEKRGGEWQTKAAQMVEENLSLVYETVVGDNGTVAYLTDAGEGEEDAKILSVKEMNGQERTQQYENGTHLSDLQYKEGKIYFSQGENVNALTPWQENVSVLMPNQDTGEGQVRVLFRNGQPAAVITEVRDGFASNLYISYGDNGRFTNPVPITDFDEKIRSWDVNLNEDDSIDVSALLVNIEVGEEKNAMTETARLIHTTVKPMDDIILSEIFTEENHVGRGTTTTFLVNVENATREAVESLNVSVAGPTCGSLFEGEVSTFIEDGTTGTIAVEVPIPEDFRQQELTFTVADDGEEVNTENNSRTFQAGAANLSLELEDSHLYSDGYLEAIITNNGSTDATGDLEVTGEDGKVIHADTAGNVPAGSEKRVTIRIPDDKRTFTDDADSYGVTAEVSHGGEESTDIDNEAGLRIRPPRVTQISVSERTLTMAPQETYQPLVQVYPSNALNKEYRICSSDEAVVTVDENGFIRAVSEGTADIIYMAANSGAAARMTVTVVEGNDTGTLHKIMLNANGGTVSPQRLEVQDGQSAALPCPMREGFYFTGWTDALEGGHEITGNTAITQNMTLYARWTDTRPPNSELPDNPNPDNPDPDNPDPDDPNPDNPDPDDPNPDIPGTDNPNPGTPSVPGNIQTPQEENGTGDNQTGGRIPQEQVSCHVGDVFSVNGLRYRVTSVSQRQGEVQLMGAVGTAKKNVTIPAEVFSPSTGKRFQVTSIGNNAFKNQKKIRKVTIGKNVSVIGKRAFFNCKKLKTITIRTKMLTKKTVGAKAFRGIYSRASAKVPKKKRTLYRKILRAKGAGAQTRIR